MRQYETILVIQPTLDDEGVTGVVTVIEELILRGGGEIVLRGQLIDRKGHVGEATDSWTKRRLAYPIGGHKEGYYAILHYTGPTEIVGQVEQSARLNESVLRYLTVRPEE